MNKFILVFYTSIFCASLVQLILKEINFKYSLEGLMLKLKLQYFGHLLWRVDSLEKTLMLGKIAGRRRKGWQDELVGWHHWLNGHEFEQTPGDTDGQGSLACCSPGGRKELDMTEWLNWTEEFCLFFWLLLAYVLLPGKSHGWRSLVGCSPWGR